MIRNNRPWGPVAGLVLIFFFFFSPLVLAGSHRLAPRRGVLLVADKKIGDARFRQSVILLVSHNMRQSTGLIINKPTDVPAGKLLLDLPALAQHPVFFGGPVEPGRGHLLIRSDDPPEGSAPVLDDVHYLGSRPRDRGLGEYRGIRLFFGYAGWAPGQLAAEIERGDWHVAPGDADTVFAEDSEGLWSRLYAEFDAVWI